MARVLSLAFLVASCTHPQDQSLTAAEHRELAALHEARADSEREQFDPTKTREMVARTPFTELPDSVMNEYNPTGDHLVAADRELRRAAQHSRAAQQLEAFEDAACRNVSPEERAACPLLASQVAVVQNDRLGVRLIMKPGVDAGAVERRLQCHLAWARTTSFERPSCPLFMRGMTISLRPGAVIALHGDSAAVARALQQQARHIFTGEAGEPVSARP
jgi:hypothetical protein